MINRIKKFNHLKKIKITNDVIVKQNPNFYITKNSSNGLYKIYPNFEYDICIYSCKYKDLDNFLENISDSSFDFVIYKYNYTNFSDCIVFTDYNIHNVSQVDGLIMNKMYNYLLEKIEHLVFLTKIKERGNLDNKVKHITKIINQYSSFLPPNFYIEK